MVSTPEQRAHGLNVLRHLESHSWTDIHNAVLDVRRNPRPEDKALLEPLLEHEDPMVVAATLYALTHVYGTVEEYRDLIMKLAQGDPRDDGEMPLQREAIEDLADLASRDSDALELLWQIAEEPGKSEFAREIAWFCLAHHYGVEWQRSYSEALIWDPEGPKSREIQVLIRTAASGRTANGDTHKPKPPRQSK